MKEELIRHLSNLLSYNVIGDIQYRNRFNGFVGELDFQEYMVYNRGNELLDGGMFLPTKQRAESLDNPIFFTVSPHLPTAYVELYERFAKLGCKSMFFINWDDSREVVEWQKEDIMGVDCPLPIPSFNVYNFDINTNKFELSGFSDFLSEFENIRWTPRNAVSVQTQTHFANILSRFDLKAIMGLYVQRLVFDGFIGFRRARGIPADIDGIVRSKKDDNFILFEVKEKDLSKTHPVGFGMDTGRINFYEKLLNTTGFEVFYIIKQVANQRTRDFINWRSINMLRFIENTGIDIREGGTGMRSTSSSNPTRICPDKFFTKL